MAKETCIVCGGETPDLCCCYTHTEENTISISRDMVKDTPNDQTLGEEIRKLYNKSYGN